MKRITEVTRRDLFDTIQNGFNKTSIVSVIDPIYGVEKKKTLTEHIYMPYHGRYSEIDFLDRLYNLESLPSTDYRYKNAKGDIHCHTVNFDDWPAYWFLDDDRFQLKNEYDDEPLLRFLCEMLHPAVRDEEAPWMDYLEHFNELLKRDGYEIYSAYKISGQDVFKFHDYIPRPVQFEEQMLFTKRYHGLVQIGHGMPVDLICSNVSDKSKKKIVDNLLKFAEPQVVQPDRYITYTIKTDALYVALKRLNEYHEFLVVELNRAGYFGNRYEDRLLTLFTPFLFDLIEIQCDELSKSERACFIESINCVFKNDHLSFMITDRGIIEQVLENEVLDNLVAQQIGDVKEVGLRELLEEAISLHQRPETIARRDAMEKIWDAFERLKTYYTTLDKKTSSEKIVSDMAGGNTDYIALINAEFKALTDIGNAYRIRHHETNKVDITDPRYYDYFFNRCLSLIAMAIQYLQ